MMTSNRPTLHLALFESSGRLSESIRHQLSTLSKPSVQVDLHCAVEVGKSSIVWQGPLAIFGRNSKPAVCSSFQHVVGKGGWFESLPSSRESLAVAIVAHEPSLGRDALSFAEQIWHNDPTTQVIALAGSPCDTWNERVAALRQANQLLVLRDPFHPIEFQQALRNQLHRWMVASDANAHVFQLQMELDRRIEKEAALKRRAEHDALTGLPNRAVLLQSIRSIVERYERGQASIDALLFLDLDDFKQVNDTCGHQAGDQLLIQVAGRLRASVRSREMQGARTDIARLGGDEFVVLVENMHKREDASAIAQRVVEKIAQPFEVDNRNVQIGSSVGIAFIEKDLANPEMLLKKADTAMYRAKLSGKGQVVVFDDSIHQAIQMHEKLGSALEKAIERGELQLHYQPAVSFEDFRVQAVEGLMRWTHEGTHAIPPSEFIPLAEEIGIISEIGDWAIEQAAKDLKRFQTTLPSSRQPLEMHLNLSPHQFRDEHFSLRAARIVDKVGVARSQIRFEFTEKNLVNRQRDVEQRLSDLADQGFGICIDDFGTGQSPLSLFHRFPINCVKIDCGFMRDIHNNRSHQAIVEAVSKLAHGLEASVVAEGLETGNQVRCAQRLGCDAGQGHYFEPPAEASKLIEILQNQYAMEHSVLDDSHGIAEDSEPGTTVPRANDVSGFVTPYVTDSIRGWSESGPSPT